jgi:DNA polymerase
MAMNEKQKILSDARDFLRQQEEMYGGDVLIEKSTSSQQIKPKEEVKKNKQTEHSSVKEPVSGRLETLPTLAELQKTVSVCIKCQLCKTRTQTVFGSGNTKAVIMFIGEAPGADEDAQGLPFVGRAGQLLTKMIEESRSLGLPRSEVYIANILKCRPPENRKPQPGEIEQCEPYLIAQIENIRPKIICALGATAANTLLNNSLSMGAMRGQTYDYHGTPLLVTYHPAALLRNPNWKQPAWDDMLRLRAIYEESVK